jgi:anti-sigma factor RsiW
MISCHDAVREMWDYLDGTLDEPNRVLVDEHLSRCLRCCGELEFARELRRTMADAAHQDVPEDVLQRLTETLEELET